MEKIILILLSIAQICICINSILFVKRLTAIESVRCAAGYHEFQIGMPSEDGMIEVPNKMD